jgi:hypothetical protein
MEMLIRLEGRTFVVGLVVGKTGRVERTPDIVKYLRGKRACEAVAYAVKRGWRVRLSWQDEHGDGHRRA